PDQHRPEDQASAHRGRSDLLLVRFRRVLADVARALLQPAQRLDVAGTEEEADHQRYQPGHQHAEARVAQHVEEREAIRVLEEEVVEHQAPPALASASLMRSIFIPRDPFTSTTSSGRTRSCTSFTASAGSSVDSIDSAASPASSAPSPSALARFPKQTRSERPAPAAKRPTSRCRSSSVWPSSSMSPSTAMARPLPRTRWVSVKSAALVLLGFAL